MKVLSFKTKEASAEVGEEKITDMAKRQRKLCRKNVKFKQLIRDP
jgi:hypothetical protein